jgi:hypothetical protein
MDDCLFWIQRDRLIAVRLELLGLPGNGRPAMVIVNAPKFPLASRTWTFCVNVGWR